jgi:hypothetical protein
MTDRGNMNKKKNESGPVSTVAETGGHDPMAAFANYADAQGFIVALRGNMLKGTKPTDIELQGKIYAVCDLASSAVYMQEQMAKDSHLYMARGEASHVMFSEKLDLDEAIMLYKDDLDMDKDQS